MAEKEKILVHVCCASCSSYVLPHLAERFDVTAYYYNPNIHPIEEYRLRLEEMKALCRRLGFPFIKGPYDPGAWRNAVGPYRHLPEKSERCWECYSLRIDRTAAEAARLGIGIFTTTLSVSPHKIHVKIVELGEAAAARSGLRFLGEDFKKKNGFKISVERSRELGLTRQNYCGCSLSLEESKKRDRSGSEDDPAA
jgi:predicted adenine nucleotide alpha hydrolase (AANH) superfamily ATPase